jgi:hypothetical protein
MTRSRRFQFTAEQRELLERFRESGIDFMLYVEGGTIFIEEDDLEELLEDPEAYKANYHGVSVEQFRAWRDSSYQCLAKTKKGRQCLHRAIGASSPKEFVSGVSDYCRYHQEHI